MELNVVFEKETCHPFFHIRFKQWTDNLTSIDANDITRRKKFSQIFSL